MNDKAYIDYYEVLEASPHAGSETIERLFRHLAKSIHPDGAGGGDVQKFSLLVDAYHTLKDATARAAYDVEYQRQNNLNKELVNDAACADTDTIERHKLLSLFYAKRRRDLKCPGVAPTSLEQMMGCSPEVLNFHLWYFREKGWINREESGLLSITAAGVDRIDEMNMAYASSGVPRITVENDRIELATAGAC